MQGFEIAEANVGDIDALADVHESSLRQDWIYWRIFRDVNQEAVRDFSRVLIGRRLNSDHSRIFKITDESTQSIVAWAGLEYPHVPDTEQMASKPIPFPVGAHEELLQIFLGPLSRGVSTGCGYDSRHDFHRAGTRVEPAYQRRGLATMLGHHMNAIVEAAGERLFVCVRPAAVRMCEKDGYQEVAKYEVDLSRFGGHGLDTSVVFVKSFNRERTP